MKLWKSRYILWVYNMYTMAFNDIDACDPSMFFDGVCQWTRLKHLLRMLIKVYNDWWWSFSLLECLDDKFVKDLSVSLFKLNLVSNDSQIRMYGNFLSFPQKGKLYQGHLIFRIVQFIRISKSSPGNSLYIKLLCYSDPQ